jgi:tryptophan synthase alpha chain
MQSNRLVSALSALAKGRKKALSLYVTAGYPRLNDTVPIVAALAAGGADLIELGVPFSDPIADGPTIQHSSELALRNGMTLDRLFQMVKDIRSETNVPLVIMGYANPAYRFGLERFVSTSAQAGADAMIVPDLPLEESSEYRGLLAKYNLASIFLAAPTTSDDRLRMLDAASTGFLYGVSVTGVTGARDGVSTQVSDFLLRARATVTKNPLLIGFGISTPEDAVRIASHADGVIIGSALIKSLASTSNGTAASAAKTFSAQFRKALDN